MPSETIIEFAEAELDTPEHDGDSLLDVTFRLQGGDMLVVMEESIHDNLPLADAACGLLLASRGRVMFRGTDWAVMDPDAQLRHRGTIGRVFSFQGWVHNLDVMDNVALSQRYHTLRPDAEIVAEAESLARRFGLSGVPSARPAWVRRSELRRAEWIRAFMGAPILILLERPEQDVEAEAIRRLMDAAVEACSRGAAVIWITRDAAVASHPRLGAARQAVVRGSRLESKGGVG